MSATPFERLAMKDGMSVLTAEQVDGFAAGPGDRVLFFGGDPNRRPESDDLAVILPQIREAFQGRFDVGAYLQCPEERDLMAKYGVVVIPTLVFLRDGKYVGTVPRLQDWSVYLDKIADLLNKPTGELTQIGVTVAAE